MIWVAPVPVVLPIPDLKYRLSQQNLRKAPPKKTWKSIQFILEPVFRRAESEKRNEIVHWLRAMHLALNTQNMMIVGVTLIHPSSLGDKLPPQNYITSNHLLDFATKCHVFVRLCTMFTILSAGRLTGDEAKPRLDMFQQSLVYPLPEGHPVGPEAP